MSSSETPCRSKEELLPPFRPTFFALVFGVAQPENIGHLTCVLLRKHWRCNTCPSGMENVIAVPSAGDDADASNLLLPSPHMGLGGRLHRSTRNNRTVWLAYFSCHILVGPTATPSSSWWCDVGHFPTSCDLVSSFLNFGEGVSRRCPALLVTHTRTQPVRDTIDYASSKTDHTFAAVTYQLKRSTRLCAITAVHAYLLMRDKTVPPAAATRPSI